jgi:hypothetical protein
MGIPTVLSPPLEGGPKPPERSDGDFGEGCDSCHRNPSPKPLRGFDPPSGGGFNRGEAAGRYETLIPRHAK